MPLLVPLQALPSQTVNVVLNNQFCTIKVYQKFWGLFVDLSVSNTVVIQGVICQNNNLIVRSTYLGFVGDLQFNDGFGTFDPNGNPVGSDPFFEGLGNPTTARFTLVYLFPSELPDDYGQGPFDPDVQVDINDWNNAFPNIAVTSGGGTSILNPVSMR